DDQYLMIAAQPTAVPDPGAPIPLGDDLDGVLAAVERFATAVPQKIAAWQEKIAAFRAQGQKITLWGGGSKAVAFLTTLGLGVDEIPYVVDINPHKTGTFLASSGQEIVAPDYLPGDPPDVVIIMNPIYRAEIGRDLEVMGLNPTIMTVEDI
ncbi:MAG: hypothetical protein KC441_16725, partial [Anaerolineales bacterium]|nr:hypothetical protein [Anaerolineales bacterium]